MKKISILFLLLILANPAFAQFDEVIFQKHLHLNRTVGNDIYPLGDQNGDGYDDFMTYDCLEKKAKIFFGGNPVDTIPVYSIQFFDSVYTQSSIAVIDLNNDSIKDLVVTTRKYLSDIGYFAPGDIRIYYGGDKINTIPNLIFNPPEGVNNNFGITDVLNDFNGDGRDELVIFDPWLPNSDKIFGTFYFYNTGTKFDTIPGYILKGDSVTEKRYWELSSSGDISGDGKEDLTIWGTYGDDNSSTYFRDFFIGNENWNLEPSVEYKEEEHSFDVTQMQIVKNVVGNNNDDIIITDYNNFYPFYFKNVILSGSFPIDTIPVAGINTQNEGLNINLTFVNDYNGDGYNDIFARTHAFGEISTKLWIGGTEFSEEAKQSWIAGSEGFGTMIGNVGDIDGDGVNDLGFAEASTVGLESCVEGVLYVIKGDTSVKGIVGIKEEIPSVPENYKLYDPYPNPFNPETRIEYDIKTKAVVEIKVYDTLGKEIGLIINEEKQPGKYSIDFNADKYELSSGVYILSAKFYDGKKLLAKRSVKITYLK